MPNVLSPSSVRVIDPILSSVAQGYSNQEMVGNVLFPTAYVAVSGGQILEFGREAFRLYSSARTPGSATRRVQYGYLGKPFALFNHSLEGMVPREYQRDASLVPGVDLGSGAVRKTMKALKLSVEVEQAALATNAANYGAGNKITLAGATKWSVSTGVPLADIDTGREAIRSQCGVYPNVLLLSAVGFNACKNNPNIVARFQYTSAQSITPDMLAGLFNVKKVIVGAGVYWNDANVATDIWGNNAVLAFVPEGQLSDPDEPSYGYTYTMTGNPAADQPYYDDNSKSWIYPVTYERAPVLSGISAGYLIQNPA
ncbi:major capsid protein [Rhodocyclus tenuis]|uniref:Phage capsid protein n=1 Tax=Rhodocyclus tenuis TaxID=1066 RepID=A0A840G5D5_RHOTE|nr:major capsid protein [Rhodocyclus tenuis]MBB4246551.1 hypothetical protein [Rhodocyclus tenuis]